MRARPVVVVALTCGLGLGLGACTTGELAGLARPAAAGDEPGAAGAADGEDPGLARTMRDGVWPVGAAGAAGEVEFRLRDRGLELVGVAPADGWEVTDEQAGPAEIEVGLRSTDVRAEVEVSVRDGILEIEVDQSFDPPPAGPLDLGDAGTVELLVSDDGVRLGEVVLGDGWRETLRADRPGEVEVGLTRNGPGTVETWEVEARLDDGGLEVLTDHEIQGPVAR